MQAYADSTQQFPWQTVIGITGLVIGAGSLVVALWSRAKKAQGVAAPVVGAAEVAQIQGDVDAAAAFNRQSLYEQIADPEMRLLVEAAPNKPSLGYGTF